MPLWKKIENYFVESKSKSDADKRQTALDLKHEIENEFKSMSTESQVKLMTFIRESILKAYHSNDILERKIGMILMFYLIDLEVYDYGLKLSCLKEVTSFSSSSDFSIMTLNASIFIKFVQISFMNSDMFDYEIKKAKKYLVEEQGDRKTYTLILYNQSSSSIPAMFFPYILDSFHPICACISDPRPTIRELVLSLIQNCFKIFIPREDREPRISRCYDVLFKTISYYILTETQRTYPEEQLLSSLRALHELINICCAHTLSLFNEISCAFITDDQQGRSPVEHEPLKLKLTSDRFLKSQSSVEGAANLSIPLSSKLFPSTLSENYNLLVEFLFKHLSCKNIKILEISINMITLLAGFDKYTFTASYLLHYFRSLINLLKYNKGIYTIYLSFAVIISELEDVPVSYFDNILDCISSGVVENLEKRKNVVIQPMVLACLSCLSKYCREAQSDKLCDILKCILENTILSQAVVTTLTRSRYNLKNYDQLVACLVQKVLDNLNNSKISNENLSLGLATSSDEFEQVILSLRSIRILEVSDMKIFEMLYDSSKIYLYSPHKTVRLEAVKTCCQILSCVDLSATLGIHDRRFKTKTRDTLDKLVEVGISDVERDIRLFVLTYLAEYNQPRLCTPRILSLLALGLYDESLEIRGVVIELLGNLSTKDPSGVNHILEKYYLECLSSFKQSIYCRNSVAVALPLHYIVVSCPHMAHSCMNSVLDLIIPLISFSGFPSEFISVLVMTMSDLSFFCSKKMLPYIPDFVNVIVQILLRPGLASTRGLAVDSLISLLLYTGYFISNKKYQEIFDALLSLLKIEQTKSIKRSIINALGCLGARDPYKLLSQLKLGDGIAKECEQIVPWRDDHKRRNVCELLQLHSSSGRMDEFYSGVCINVLSKILLDRAQQAHHSLVVQVIQNIYTSNGNNCFQYLSLLMPTYLAIVNKSEPDMKKIILGEIGKLIQSSKSKPFPYVQELFTLLEALWVDPASPIGLKSSIIKIIEYLVNILPTESGLYLPNILIKLTVILLNDPLDTEEMSEENQLITLLLSALQRMAQNLGDTLFLIVPALIRVFSASNLPVPLQTLAISTLQTLYNFHDAKDFISPTVQALLLILTTKQHLQTQGLSLLVLLVEKYPRNMEIFISSIKQTLVRARINSPTLESAMILATEYPFIFISNERRFTNLRSISSVLKQRKGDLPSTSIPKYASNNENLLRAFQTIQRVSKDDWIDWLNRVTLELIKESPSVFLRYCAILSQSYSPIGRSLLHYSFFSCWKEISYSCRETITNCLMQSLELQDMNEVVIPILNLVEFIEHTDCDQLMITHKKLAKCAFEASAYVKALRYTEMCLRESDDIDALQSLLTINIILNNRDAAEGVLIYAIKRNLIDFTVQQRWFEKLHDWENALVAYENKLKDEPSNIQLHMGKMRCLEALCEWKQLDEMVSEHWAKAEGEERIEISRMGSFCSLGQEKWDNLKIYSSCIPRERFEGSFLNAIHHIKSDQLQKAKRYLNDARDLMENELNTVLSESYTRSYRSLVIFQMLTELEEVINYKLFPTHRETIKDTWHKRLMNCKQITHDLQRLLDQRTLVLTPRDDVESRLKFASICLKRGRNSLCKNAFEKLLTSEEIRDFNEGNIPDIDPFLVLGYIKFMWSSGANQLAYSTLSTFVNNILNPPPDSRLNLGLKGQQVSYLLSKCYLQLGQWNISGILGNRDVNVARENFLSATHYNKKSYKAWYAWSKFNYDIVLSYVQDNKIPTMETQEKTELDGKLRTHEDDEHVSQGYVVPAIKSLFKCIQHSNINSFQDTLRLFTLWFEFGEIKIVYELLCKEIENVKIDNWLQVIPQLIARLDTPKVKVRSMICKLLIQIGSIHPQAIIYPLMVSTISIDIIRKNAARDVLKTISANFPVLVDQAAMMSHELIRVSILWYEECQMTIEEASRLLFNDKNIPASLKLLDSIHLKIMNQAETPTEISFLQNFQGMFHEALCFRNLYASSQDIRYLTQAWTIYYQIFKLLNKKIEMFESVDLRLASPMLYTSRNLSLSMPGTYIPHNNVVLIQKVDPILKVIDSKQKPRKISMLGNDGQRYEYLLKGREDLRQDERVMQLFGLLNTILTNNHATFKRKLAVKRYSVTPLSTNSGLIGWVANCDTLKSLIKEQRIKAKVDPLIENKLIMKYCPKYESLDFLHKLEFFEMIIESTGDNELADSLWQKSTSSEIWFEKRINFTRSLSLMSMVGYILGLGDRHPLNIMQELTTGQIIHIDFGDCFEVTMKRDNLPEKVPFRLTRMLTKCVEVTGIDGIFRVTSIRVMEFLAALEAFIYDPLLGWRLLDQSSTEQENKSSVRSRPFDRDSPNAFFTANYHTTSTSYCASNEKSYQQEILNKKAMSVINRIKDKLYGRDFYQDQVVSVDTQVELLTKQATSIENLSQSYIGWCPFW
ncbi:Serine/threonine-protein kinase mTOR [Thelohanellus kitauei]|uniref:Serine/threonine-protein kinase TOR n=1 Tax=Thelohanellus kitauei TaxID=669202 RepID=A0A0C2NKL9_THEKT|nr:Serine/threonine-protein kinase mTOR [Thelohanellus kitauei]